MQITFYCDKCGSTLQTDASLAGSAVECPQCNQTLTVPAAEIKEGTTLGGFQIERLLGKGGMGEVYLARQLSMDRPVALKILPAQLRMDRDSAARFLQEVRLLARLEHPNIVAAHEAGDDGGVLFLAMAYVQGQSLEDRIKREGHLGWKEACGLVRKLVGALAYAWDEHQLLHRDIKPANVLLDSRGEPKLVDMGLAKSLHAREGLTMSSMTMGTPNYMSPEQIEARADLDFRTDMYALGATLWQMLTGKKPFQGSSLMDTLRKQATEPLADPRQYAPDIPEGVVTLLEVMLAKDREHRHESWAALSADLQRVLAGRMPQRRPPPAGDSALIRGVARQKSATRPLGTVSAAPAEPAPAPAPRRSPVPWIAAAGVVVVVVLGLVFWLGGKSQRANVPGQQVRGAESVTIPVQKKADRNSDEFRSGEASEDRDAKAEAELASILNYEKQNPAGYAQLLPRLEKLSRDAAGTKQGLRVYQELERVRTAKKDAIGRALASLKSAVEAQAAAGQFAAAEQAAAGYAGPFAAETVAERAELARWVKGRATERADAQRRQTEQAAEEASARVAEAQGRVASLLDEAAADVLKQDVVGAATKLRNAGQDPKFAGASSELAAAAQFVQALGTIEERILKSFNAQIGQTIRIESRGGVTESCTVLGVAGGKVRMSRAMGAATVEKQLGLADLNLKEKQQRVGEGKKSELLVMRGLLALEAKDLAGAQALFAEAAVAEGDGILTNSAPKPAGSGIGDNSVPVPGMASAIARVAGRATAEGREKAARQVLQTLIQLAGVTNAPTGGTLADAVGQREYTANQVKRIRAGVADFRKQHAETTVAKENAALLDALAAVDTQPGAMKVDIGGGVTLELVWIKPGKFLMGSPANEAGREVSGGKETQHEVTITKGFWMGKYEVTQAQWERVMGNNPSKFKDAGKDAPVEQVSWNDCQEFLKKLNSVVRGQGAGGREFRLPTEAEWEYACRAGTKTAYCFGDDPADLHRYGNYREKSSGLPVGGQWWEKTDLEHDDGFKTTAPVGKYRPNAWGLYDMHGNVHEWCQDYSGDYAVGDAKDPMGPSSGSRRVLRGGSWGGSPVGCRAANRRDHGPTGADNRGGVRVVVAVR